MPVEPELSIETIRELLDAAVCNIPEGVTFEAKMKAIAGRDEARRRLEGTSYISTAILLNRVEELQVLVTQWANLYGRATHAVSILAKLKAKVGEYTPFQFVKYLEGLMVNLTDEERKFLDDVENTGLPQQWTDGADGQHIERRLRAWVHANPYFGKWDDWVEKYDQMPVYTRMVMSHIHGRHDLTEQPYNHCVLCEIFRG